MIPEPDVEARYRKVLQEVDSYRSRMRPEQRAYDGNLNRLENAEQTAKRWIERIREADAESAPVTFRLDWLEQKPGPEDVATRLLSKATRWKPDYSRSDSRRRGTADKLTPDIWFHNGRVLALCPPDDPRRVRIAEHHPVHDVTTFEPLVLALRQFCAGVNRWRADGELEPLAETRAFEEETGISLPLTRELLLVAITEGRNHPTTWNDEKVTSVQRSAENDDRFRRILDEVLDRELLLGEGSEGVPFALEAARDAPLVHGPGSDRGATAIANLGAGRLLRLSFTRYVNEKPSPIRCSRTDPYRSDFICDGRDIRIVAIAFFDENLEGTVHRSVHRRREEAARRARDDD